MQGLGVRDNADVSILVFLEPLLRPIDALKDLVAETCFNPCFSGTTT